MCAETSFFFFLFVPKMLGVMLKEKIICCCCKILDGQIGNGAPTKQGEKVTGNRRSWVTRKPLMLKSVSGFLREN